MADLTHSQLQSVFPDATELEAPDSRAAIFRAGLRSIRTDQLTWVLLYVAGQVVAPLVLMAAGYPTAAVLTAAALILVPVVVIAVLFHRATSTFWDTYAAARGLSHEKNGRYTSDVPLLRKGDRRSFPHVLSGTIGGVAARLMHYQYTETSGSGEDQSESTYRFTLVQFNLPAAVARRYVGVYLRPKSISFGRLQDRLAHDRGITLASTEFNSEYSLRVDNDQDDIALYELFSTTFVDQLIREFRATWEQRGDDLVVFERGHVTDAARLDDLCLRAARVLQRYLEEHQ